MSSVARKAIHQRRVVYDAYVREDGLFDIEGRLSDQRTYESYNVDREVIRVGDAVHDMVITATVDEHLKLVAITSTMHSVPTGECRQTQAVLQALVGHTMARGWRKAINHAMGGVEGCTHMRELLFNMATAAYQAVPIYARFYGKGPDAAFELTQAPPHLNQCMTWRIDGDPVRRVYPQFYIAPADQV